MLIALCADKGSAGVTTTALVLASAWPAAATVVEADPTGGDLPLRLRPGGAVLPETPTVLTILTAARAHRDQDPVAEHSHVLNASTRVVPGALLAEQMAVAGDWLPLADALSRRDEASFLDIGEVAQGSPMLAVAAHAELVVVVARPQISSIIRIRERLPRLANDLAQLRGVPPRLMPILVTTARHGPAEVADLRRMLEESTSRPFLVDFGFLAYDPRAVRHLEAGADPCGRLARTNLMRTARTVVGQVADAVGQIAWGPKLSAGAQR